MGIEEEYTGEKSGTKLRLFNMFQAQYTLNFIAQKIFYTKCHGVTTNVADSAAVPSTATAVGVVSKNGMKVAALIEALALTTHHKFMTCRTNNQSLIIV